MDRDHKNPPEPAAKDSDRKPRRWLRTGWRPLCWLLAGYLIIVLLAMFLEEKLIFLPFDSEYDDWNPAALDNENVDFRAADGTRLHGWYVPHEDPKAVVLFCHGNAGNITHRIDTPRGPLTAVTVRDPATDTTWTVKYPVESPADIEKIRSLPWSAPADLAPPDMAILPADFETRRIIRAVVSSPFVCVAGMMPYQQFLELCATNLALVEELTSICLERILAILDVVLAERTVEFLDGTKLKGKEIRLEIAKS